MGDLAFQFTHPGRGATRWPLRWRVPRSGFNSRTPGGVRLTANTSLTKLQEFQFTHPGRGATPSTAGLRTTSRGFNSRTPGGVRLSIAVREQTAPSVSIHAPREGCDATGDAYTTRYDVSIHAPREGCDVGRTTLAPGRWVSIHAPREGCDRVAPEALGIR